ADTAKMGGANVVVRLGTGHLFNLGQLVAANALDVEAGEFTNGPDGRLSGAGVRLALTGATNNHGRIEATGDLAVKAPNLANTGSIIANAAGDIQIAGAVANNGLITAQRLALGIGSDLKNSGQIGAHDDLTTTVGGRVDNTGSLIAKDGDLSLTVGGLIASSGDIIAGGRLALAAAAYETPADTARIGGADVVVRLGTGHLFNLGQFVAANALDVEAGEFTNGPAGHLSGASIRLALTGAADNKGSVETTGDLALTTQNLANSGTIQVNGAAVIEIADGFGNSGGLLTRSLALKAGGDFVNSGQIGAVDDLTATVGGRVDNTGRLIAKDGDLSLTAGGIVASSGDIIAKGRLALTAAAYET
ncbi:adhesin HecA family 20-residue repeat-containing protein, partial [Methylobacterium brachiatum]